VVMETLLMAEVADLKKYPQNKHTCYLQDGGELSLIPKDTCLIFWNFS